MQHLRKFHGGEPISLLENGGHFSIRKLDDKVKIHFPLLLSLEQRSRKMERHETRRGHEMYYMEIKASLMW